MKLLNAFSLNMLDTSVCQRIDVMPISTEAVRRFHVDAYGPLESAVGHADTAAIFSDVLGFPVECNRATVTLQRDESAIVGQYIGPRLPEGARTLPEGAIIKWLLVVVKEYNSESE